MNNYLDKIIRHFFNHNTDTDIQRRVYRRITMADEQQTETAFRNIWDNLETDVTADVTTGNNKLRIMRRYYRTAAAWILPLLMVAVALYLTTANRVDSEPELVRHYTAPGSIEQVTLPDSTQVWLNAGSMLMYPRHYNGRERYAYLYGEAFFDVTKDAGHPFIVKTGNLSVKVLGTTFNINSYLGAIDNVITLETGLIDIILPDSTTYRIEPDQQLCFNSLTGNITTHKVNASNYSGWRNGELDLCNLSFDEAMARIGRAHGLKIRILDSRLNNERVYVRFTRDEPIENVMSILNHLIPGMNYYINDSTVTIN